MQTVQETVNTAIVDQAPLVPPAALLVVGAGTLGSRHLMNAKALGVSRLTVFRTGDGPPRRPLPPGVCVSRDLDRSLAERVEAVVIANPTPLHLDTAMKAAQLGCHLLVEMPLSHSLAGVTGLIGVARLQRITALVGYQYRYHEAFRQIRRWLIEGAIGEIVSAHACWGERPPDCQLLRDYQSSDAARSELGYGVLLTLSHPLDYLRWLLGEVSRVSAVTNHRSGLELDVEETALVHLEFQSGAVASVSLDYVQHPQNHTLTIVGRCGAIRWNSVDDTAQIDTPGRHILSSRPSFGSKRRRNQMFIAEMTHFFNCIAGRERPACTIEDGERIVRICLAARESAASGRRIDV